MRCEIGNEKFIHFMKTINDILSSMLNLKRRFENHGRGDKLRDSTFWTYIHGEFLFRTRSEITISVFLLEIF